MEGENDEFCEYLHEDDEFGWVDDQKDRSEYTAILNENDEDEDEEEEEDEDYEGEDDEYEHYEEEDYHDEEDNVRFDATWRGEIFS